ncbi:hypothetical protein WA158_007037 [Blastocystis sp. Blastoise]
MATELYAFHLYLTHIKYKSQIPFSASHTIQITIGNMSHSCNLKITGDTGCSQDQIEFLSEKKETAVRFALFRGNSQFAQETLACTNLKDHCIIDIYGWAKTGVYELVGFLDFYAHWIPNNKSSLDIENSSDTQALLSLSPKNGSYYKYESCTVSHYQVPQGIYSGEFCNKRMNGSGQLLLSNGDSYKGSFVNNKIEGKGIYTYNSGDIYEGSFWDNQFFGSGCIIYANGNRLEIEENGEKSMYYNNGDYYKGEWEGYIPEGVGIYTYYNGNIYEGEFNHGYFNGMGTMYYINGDIFEGIFKDGKKNGEGIYKICNMKYLQCLGKFICIRPYDIIDGKWTNDYCVEIISSTVHKQPKLLLNYINKTMKRKSKMNVACFIGLFIFLLLFSILTITLLGIYHFLSDEFLHRILVYLTCGFTVSLICILCIINNN